MKVILYVLLSFVLAWKSFAQSNKKEINKSIHFCVEKNSKIYTLSSFNVYDYCIAIEQILVENNLLLKNDKKSYYNLLLDIAKSKKDDRFFKIYEKINQKLYHSDVLMNPGVFSTVFVCFSNVMEEFEIDERFGDFKENIDTLMERPVYNDFSLNKKMIFSVPEREVSNITFKAPIIAVLYSNLYYYNEAKGENNKWLLNFEIE
ncbi:hypothetical protein [Tenacibaculum sp. M341]|uniref:hypothetical protein n=1 Tax=Tenacibaculum sp. M341 TaxID=2530339 RepID=UPI0010472A44|nr:hypothetical protein [Tenacibaculum sp. M341]TCI91366.1 hypothetical protein EYW44_10440 [Tenacibaculum sp. M341]